MHIAHRETPLFHFLLDFWHRQISASIIWNRSKFYMQGIYYKVWHWFNLCVHTRGASALFFHYSWNGHNSASIWWNYAKFNVQIICYKKICLFSFGVFISREGAAVTFSSFFWKGISHNIMHSPKFVITVSETFIA